MGQGIAAGINGKIYIGNRYAGAANFNGAIPANGETALQWLPLN